jgi:hypothetical protein
LTVISKRLILGEKLAAAVVARVRVKTRESMYCSTGKLRYVCGACMLPPSQRSRWLAQYSSIAELEPPKIPRYSVTYFQTPNTSLVGKQALKGRIFFLLISSSPQGHHVLWGFGCRVISSHGAHYWPLSCF